MGTIWKEEDLLDRRRRIRENPDKEYEAGDYSSIYGYEPEKMSQNTKGTTLSDRVHKLEKKLKLAERTVETKKETKQFKFPFRWRMKFSQAKRKSRIDQMLVLFLNKKNEIEPPKFMPIFDGNMIVWKNKPYEFDPRAVWTIRGMKGNPKAYLIKEIDRRPVRNHKGELIYRDAAVSNMDLAEIRRRGDSTESDEFLIKASLKAQTSQMRKNVNIVAVIIIGLIAVGGIIWFMFGGGVQ